jgi:hypothetical protein
MKLTQNAPLIKCAVWIELDYDIEYFEGLFRSTIDALLEAHEIAGLRNNKITVEVIA